MKIDYFSRSGALYNEDIYEANPNYAFVLDGATGLLKEKVSDMETDAQWYVHEWRNYLIHNIMDNSKTLVQIIKEGILLISKKYLQFEGADKVVSRPSSGISLFRVINNKLQYFLLGDCSQIITKTDESIIHMQIQDLPRLDGINLDRMVKVAHENGISKTIDARPLINNFLVETRLSQNTDKGYWILSDNPDAADHALTGETDFSEVQQVICLSDGYSQIYDTFKIYSVEKFAELIGASNNLSEVHNVLWNLQEKDKYCIKYPRFKLRDDATIVVFNK